MSRVVQTYLTPPQPVPLQKGSDGTIRIIGSRVTLDTIIAAFGEGATPEELVQQYPTLDLASVYAVISYYLQNRDELNAYLRERALTSKRVRQENEKRFDPKKIRHRLLARQQRSRGKHAPPGGGRKL